MLKAGSGLTVIGLVKQPVACTSDIDWRQDKK